MAGAGQRKRDNRDRRLEKVVSLLRIGNSVKQAEELPLETLLRRGQDVLQGVYQARNRGQNWTAPNSYATNIPPALIKVTLDGNRTLCTRLTSSCHCTRLQKMCLPHSVLRFLKLPW